MKYPAERWAAVGEAIRAQREQSDESQRAFCKRIRLSVNKFVQLRDGVPGDYLPATLVKVSKGLWGDGHPDAINRILRGMPPVEEEGPRVVSISRDWQLRQSQLLGYFNQASVRGQSLILGFAQTIAQEEPGGLEAIAAAAGEPDAATLTAASKAARSLLRATTGAHRPRQAPEGQDDSP